MELYAHQKEVDGMYHSKFLFVHEDTFGRSFRDMQEIIEYIKVDNSMLFDVEIISNDSDGFVNVFLLIIKDINPIKEINIYANKNNLWRISALEDVRYYDSYPCDFNLCKGGYTS